MFRTPLIDRVVTVLRRPFAPRYRPELHYMRGPGPACAARARRLDLQAI